MVKKSKLAVAVFLVATWSGLMFLSPSVFYLNMTSSLPLGVYVFFPATTIRRGDIVCYSPPEIVYEEIGRISGERPSPMLFLKKVGGLPGDRYEIREHSRAFLLNGAFFGIARETSKAGKPMPDLVGSHYVPEGEFLPVAPNPLSFDGRYTGTVSIDAIRSRAIPLIVF